VIQTGSAILIQSVMGFVIKRIYFREVMKMAEKKNIVVVVSVGLVLLLVSFHSAYADEKLFIVANQKAIDLAKDFFTTLNNESIPLKIVLDQYGQVKKEKYVIVLGGAKGSASVDDFIRQILTPDEQASGNKAGGGIYIKENVFNPGQVIIVFTGPDESAAAEARKNSRKAWWALLAKWFDLDTSQPMAY
jgi:hypothetical protein